VVVAAIESVNDKFFDSAGVSEYFSIFLFVYPLLAI